MRRTRGRDPGEGASVRPRAVAWPAEPWLPRGIPLTTQPPEGRVVIEARDGREACCYYDKDGQLHRDGGPAEIEMWLDGAEWQVSWYRHGALHRDGRPAVRRFSGKGVRTYEYYVDGVRHREDGPAFIRVSEDGSVAEYAYYLNGQSVPGAVIADEDLPGMAADEGFRDGELA